MKAATKLLALLLIAAAATLALSTRRPAPILISDAVAVPLGDGTSAVFLNIENRGTPDRLIAATSSQGQARLYSPEADPGPPSPTGAGAQLAADGAHIRLTGTDMTPGALIPLTLTFAQAGEVAFKTRLTDPARPGAATEAGLFGIGDICQVGEGEPAPRIDVTAEPDGAGWRIRLAAQDFTFSKERIDLFHVPGEGHGHLYVGGMKMGRLYAPEARIGALPPGRHIVRVTLNTNDHRAYVIGDVPVTATTEIVVD